MTVSSRRADVLRAAALAAFVAIAWCFIHDRMTPRNWRVPLFAKSDALMVLAGEKSAIEGSYLPLRQKFNGHLGAPYTGDWNDFPSTDEAFALAGGLLSTLVGLYAAGNAMVLIGHLLAALSFYTVCRALRCRWEWSWIGGVAYGLSHYAFQRGLHHLTLTYYWHIPLCLLVAWWCAAPDGLEIRSSRFAVGLAIALVTGLQSPYYTYIFLQFLGFAALAQVLNRRSWRKVAAPLLLGTACATAVLWMQVDTITYLAEHGRNPQAVQRPYRGLELYALKPLDLFMPPPGHRSTRARALALAYRNDEAKKPLFPGGEPFSQYLGLVGIGSLLALGLVSVRRAMGPARRSPPVEALGVAWVLAYSAIGGVNAILGQAGLTLFRCTNRYSVVVLGLALLFAVRALSRLNLSRVPGMTAMVFLIPLICWDQLPPRETDARVAALESQVVSDAAFTKAMETTLVPAAMVFQLPVMSFPEFGPIQQMTDYDHLRPYLHSARLRYSYGTMKGRGRDLWQLPVSQLPPAEMIAALERYGFSAIYVNRSGYADRGAALVAGLKAAGRPEVIESPDRDLICVVLHPSPTPELPPIEGGP
jgi:hypothetical protein